MSNEKKLYSKPMIEIVFFDANDVITQSGGEGGSEEEL